ncbi:MAG: hypothetical protein PHH77_05190 [Victivallaceae bacterium]|nr:hypothetical protein [Victivallaceae bacterium]
MTIEEMKAEITKEFEASFSNDELTEIQIDRAKFICSEVLDHYAADEQIENLYGFIVYCRKNPDKINNRFPGGADGYIRLNIAHDIYNFFDNCKESWFSPRTSGYRRYIEA